MVEDPPTSLSHLHYGPGNDTEPANDPFDPASDLNCMTPPGQFLLSIDSSGSVGSSVSLKPVLSMHPHLPHEQDKVHARNGYNYNRIVRERGRQMIQKMWRGKEENAVIGIFYYAQVGYHEVVPKGKVRDIVREETAFLDGCCSTVQGLLDWFSELDLGFTKLLFI